MKNRISIKTIKLLTALLFVGLAHVAMGSFTGSTEEKNKSQFSLKHFNNSFYKSAAQFSLRSGFQFKNTQVVSQKKENGSTTFTSIMRFEKGNTTYIYPYKHKITVSKFVTPAPPTIR